MTEIEIRNHIEKTKVRCMHPDVVQAIVDVLAKGKSMSAAARDNRVTRVGIYRARKRVGL